MSRNVLSVESLVLGEVALRDKCYKLNPISFDVLVSYSGVQNFQFFYILCDILDENWMCTCLSQEKLWSGILQGGFYWKLQNLRKKIILKRLPPPPPP